MKYRLCIAVLAAALAACEQAQLHGPVGGGSVTVEVARTGEQVFSGGVTLDEEGARARWPGEDGFESWNEFLRLTGVGLHQFSKGTFEPDTWYVIAVEGGFDYDRDANQLMDTAPVQVQGTVHALATGFSLNEQGISITPLSDAIYRVLAPDLATLSDEQLEQQLESLAIELVEDIDDDGGNDYADILAWNSLLAGRLAGLKVSYDDIKAYATAIADGESDAVISELAAGFFPGGGDVAVTFFEENVSEIVQVNCTNGSCHQPGGLGSATTTHDLTPTSNPDHLALNVEMYRALVDFRGVDFIVNKATRSNGFSHSGGRALNGENVEIFEEFLTLLEEGGG